MDLANLYKKQAADKELFHELRNKAWADMRQKHESLLAAFQTEDNIPPDQRKEMDLDIARYTKEWAIPRGDRYKAMEAQHKKQFTEIKNTVLPERKNEPALSFYARSLPSTKAVEKSPQRQKNADKFKRFDQNKESMDLDKDF